MYAVRSFLSFRCLTLKFPLVLIKNYKLLFQDKLDTDLINTMLVTPLKFVLEDAAKQLKDYYKSCVLYCWGVFINEQNKELLKREMLKCCKLEAINQSTATYVLYYITRSLHKKSFLW